MLKVFFIINLFSLFFSPVFFHNDTNTENVFVNESVFNQIIKKDTTGNNLVLQEVLFATNEDCELFINGDFKTAISKSAHKYVKLATGRYVYKARSKQLPDELEQSFIVNESKENEIFIDLLYFLDERKALRESLKGNKVKTSPASNSKNAKTNSVTTITAPVTYESEKELIEAFESNMVTINGGSFIMGNNKAPAIDETEHTVTLSSVRFSKYEVTQQQWEKVMGYNPSDNKGCKNCPVDNVSWEEVIKFIKKLNVAGNKKFRLPTEAEWEYVARLGGAEEIEKAGGIEAYIKNTAWYFGNADKKTHHVGMKHPTNTGIHDL